jgi:hypothetical protein
MTKPLKILLIVMLSLPTLSTSAEPPKGEWRLLNFASGRNLLLKNQGEFLQFFVVSDSISGRFGPVTMWRPVGSGQLVPVSQSLSGIDEAFRSEEVGGDRHAVGAVMEYVQLYRGAEQAYILTGEGTKAFLAQLKGQTSEKVYREIEALLPSPKTEITENRWEVSFSVVTWRGAVERRSYSGSLHPISIRKETVEVIAPAGTVPNFAFIQ